MYNLQYGTTRNSHRRHYGIIPSATQLLDVTEHLKTPYLANKIGNYQKLVKIRNVIVNFEIIASSLFLEESLLGCQFLAN